METGLELKIQRTIIFVKEMERMVHFYSQVLGLGSKKTAQTTDDWQVFGAGNGVEFALHGLPETIAMGIHISEPPAIRDSAVPSWRFWSKTWKQRESLISGSAGGETAQSSDGRSIRLHRPYSFEIGSSRSDHESIRRLMRAKYGWRDWWIGMVFDTSSSMRVKLKPTRQTTLDG